MIRILDFCSSALAFVGLMLLGIGIMLASGNALAAINPEPNRACGPSTGPCHSQVSCDTPGQCTGVGPCPCKGS